MRQLKLAAAAAALVGLPLITAGPARAGSTYVALGDSITFGETDLTYVRSGGDRGYVGRYADHLAARTGQRPEVINLAIDGETADSFMDGTGRTPPVVGRTDPILAAQNANYDPAAPAPQRDVFRSRVAAARAAGDTIDTVSITLGFNELAALASTPDTALAMLPETLATYRANYDAVLDEVRAQAPDAELFVLNYFNPFPADPASPAAPVFAAGGAQLNQIIQELAADHGARYVDAMTPFVGNEAAFTFQEGMPAGSSIGDPFGGVLPVGNVHPNDAGYAAIAGAVIAAEAPGNPTAVPLPAGLALYGPGGLLALTAAVRYRRRGTV